MEAAAVAASSIWRKKWFVLLHPVEQREEIDRERERERKKES
jgi:hypothetical protein